MTQLGAAVHARHARWADAERAARDALASDDTHTESLAILGLALHSLERFSEATVPWRTLTRLEPQNPRHWMNLGTSLRAAGRLDDALDAYARAARLGEASVNFAYNVALLHVDRAEHEAAIEVLAPAVRRDPTDAELIVLYAQCCYECLRTEAALDALAAWRSFEGATPETVAQLALLFVNLAAPAEAQAVLERLAALQPLPPAAALLVAQSLERMNRVSEARACLDAVAIDGLPDSARTDRWIVEAQIAQREKHHELAADRLHRVLATVDAPQRRHAHLFPLAKSLDALGRVADAWQTLRDAHRSQVMQLERTAPAALLVREPRLHIADFGCDAADVAQWRDDDPPIAATSPIFVVAFPRSGTTLLEQVLDAHPQLRSMDEQPFLQQAADVLLESGVRYPERLADATAGQLRRARERYWQLVRGRVELAPGERLVDKNPLNLLRLPAIRRLFPQARILLAIRHPCDVILSCYMQHFRAPEFALLCRDPPTLARGYRRAFDFWYEQASLLEPHALEIRYESFVADFESHLHRIAQFLDLPWSDAMLRPAEHAKARGFISTPSYSQVVEPVHTRAVGRWRRYETELAGILPIVAPYLARWGYEA